MPLVTTMAPAFKLTNVDDDAAPGSLSKSFIKANVETLADILTQAGKISRGIRNNCTNFYVYCFYLDFNGIEFGTVQDVSIFKPYKREINIQNLQAYPAQFAPLEKWFKNGEKLIDATKVSHLQYEGLTAGPNRKEVSLSIFCLNKFYLQK